MPHAKRVIALLLVIVAAAGLAACGSDDNEATGSSGSAAATTQESTGSGKEAIKTIVVRNGEPVGGIAELEYDAGEQVRFQVSSDVADEVHVHGYDLMKDVSAGGTVRFSFPADIEGIFEVELEERVEQIAELRVNP